MDTKTEQNRHQEGQYQEQKFVVDGCKVTVRYSGQSSPQRIKEMKSLLLSAQFPSKKV